MSAAPPGKVVSCWWWLPHHHCSAEQVDGMAAPLQTASHGVRATSQHWCLGISMPGTMSTCWTYALQRGRKNAFSCLETVSLGPQDFKNFKKQLFSFLFTAHHPPPLPPPHRTQTDGQWVLDQETHLRDRDHTVERTAPSLEWLRLFTGSNSLCLVYFFLNALPGGFSTPVQINFSCLDVSQQAWTPDDPSQAHSEPLDTHVWTNQCEVIVYIRSSCLSKGLDSWRIRICSHRFSIQRAYGNSWNVTGRY